MPNKPRDVVSYQYNAWVDCNAWQYDPDRCEHCGWNPAEWAERVVRLKIGKGKKRG